MLSTLDAALQAAATGPRAGAFQPKFKPRARKGTTAAQPAAPPAPPPSLTTAQPSVTQPPQPTPPTTNGVSPAAAATAVPPVAVPVALVPATPQPPPVTSTPPADTLPPIRTATTSAPHVAAPPPPSAPTRTAVRRSLDQLTVSPPPSTLQRGGSEEEPTRLSSPPGPSPLPDRIVPLVNRPIILNPTPPLPPPQSTPPASLTGPLPSPSDPPAPLPAPQTSPPVLLPPPPILKEMATKRRRRLQQPSPAEGGGSEAGVLPARQRVARGQGREKGAQGIEEGNAGEGGLKKRKRRGRVASAEVGRGGEGGGAGEEGECGEGGDGEDGGEGGEEEQPVRKKGRGRGKKQLAAEAAAGAGAGTEGGEVEGEEVEEEEVVEQAIVPIMPKMKRRAGSKDRRNIGKGVRRALLDMDDADAHTLVLKRLIQRANAIGNQVEREETARKAGERQERDARLGARMPGREKGQETAVDGLALAPQLQLVNGQLVINQHTLTVNAQASAKTDTGTFRRVEGSDMLLNSRSYSNWTTPERWSVEATDLFYKGLEQYGSDFVMIGRLFPNRTRKQLKSKYLKEDRNYRTRVDAALKHRATDVSHYQELMERIQEEGGAEAQAEGAGEERGMEGDGEEEAVHDGVESDAAPTTRREGGRQPRPPNPVEGREREGDGGGRSATPDPQRPPVDRAELQVPRAAQGAGLMGGRKRKEREGGSLGSNTSGARNPLGMYA